MYEYVCMCMYAFYVNVSVKSDFASNETNLKYK